MNILEIQEALTKKRQEYTAKWDSYPLKDMPDGQKSKDIPANDLEGLNKLMDEINELGKQYEEARKVHDFQEKNQEQLGELSRTNNRLHDPASPQNPTEKTLGEAFASSKQFLNRKELGGMCNFEVDSFDTRKWLEGTEFKTTMVTTSGYAPEVIRNPGVVLSAQRPVQLIDLLPMRPTSQNAIKFMEETTLTNNAAEVAQGSAAGEAALAYTERSISIQKIPVFIPVSEEQLDDVPGLQSLIDDRLVFMVRQRLDSQALGGDGVSPNIKGIRNFSGVQTYAKVASDTAMDAVMKAINKVNVTGRARADLIAMHSTDWMNIRLMRTADGIYILGNPADSVQPRLWGLPVVENEIGSAGTGTVMDARGFITLVMRTGIELSITDSHSDYFVKGLWTIKATVRAAVEMRRGAAACDFTGI